MNPYTWMGKIIQKNMFVQSSIALSLGSDCEPEMRLSHEPQQQKGCYPQSCPELTLSSIMLMVTTIKSVWFYLELSHDPLAAGCLNPSMKQMCLLVSQTRLCTHFLSLKELLCKMIYGVIWQTPEPLTQHGRSCVLQWWIAIQIFACSRTRLEYFI